MSPRRVEALAILGLLAALLLAYLTAPRWAGLFRETAEPEGGGRAPQAAGPAPTPAETRISVKLFFESAEEPALVQEERAVPLSPDLNRQIRMVVEELIKGSGAGHLPPLPPDTKVLGVFLSPRGVAFVDLSKEAVAGHGGGSAGERLSVWAVVNSVAVNFPAVKRVQILIDDRPATTLAGHVDLSRPLGPDLTLVAATAVPLEPPPAAESPPAQPSPSPSGAS